MIDKFLEFFRQWWLVLCVFIFGALFIFSGAIFALFASSQVVIKKLFLVSIFYGMTYLIRIGRIGHINWEDDLTLKKIYYFVLMACIAMILAIG